MLPKHQQHRKHREQIGRKPTDEPGLDLEHARIASSKASHALTSSIGKVMAGNVATFYSSTKLLLSSRSKTMNALANQIYTLIVTKASDDEFAALAHYYGAPEWNNALDTARKARADIGAKESNILALLAKVDRLRKQAYAPTYTWEAYVSSPRYLAQVGEKAYAYYCRLDWIEAQEKAIAAAKRAESFLLKAHKSERKLRRLADSLRAGRGLSPRLAIELAQTSKAWGKVVPL